MNSFLKFIKRIMPALSKRKLDNQISNVKQTGVSLYQ